MNSHYPALEQFLGGYLHEDWPLDAPDPLTALRDGFAEQPPEEQAAILRELATLRQELAATEPAAGARVLDGLGVRVDLDHEGVAPAAWIAKVLARLDAPGS